MDKTTRRAAAAALAAAAAAALAAPAMAAGLEGASVSTAVYCCTSSSDVWRSSNLVTRTVGDGVEIVPGDLVPTSGLGIIPIEIDFSASTIRFTYTADATAASGGFNGYRLDFAGPTRLLGFSIDASSNFAPVAVSYNEHTLLFNVAGQSIDAGATVLLNVRAVPEPGTWALLAAGGLALALRRRRRGA